MEKNLPLINEGPRADALDKVTGKATYAAEHRVPNLAYGVFVCSTIAKGTIQSIDESVALKSEGVIDIISHKNCPSIPGYATQLPDGTRNPKQWWGMKVLHDNQVRFYGQPIALIVAETVEQANAASLLLKVSYQKETFETDFNLIRKDLSKTKPPSTYTRGNVTNLEQAAVKVE
jgi:xanthine dehydrogenase YagR molybdenum-binding subunit